VILARSAAADHARRLAGAGYLINVGARTIWDARRKSTAAAPAKGRAVRPTFLPQFVDASRPLLPQSLLLARIHDAMGILWLSTYVQFLSMFKRVFERPAVKHWMGRATGVVPIASGSELRRLDDEHRARAVGR